MLINFSIHSSQHLSCQKILTCTNAGRAKIESLARDAICLDIKFAISSGKAERLLRSVLLRV